MKNSVIVRIFLASPMDVAEERETFRKAIRQVNESIGKNLSVSFEVVGWEEYVLPDAGIDAQDVVNRQIHQDYDIFVGLFRDRVGTRTHRAQSGTVEEYELALIKKNAQPDLRLMCYFFVCDTTTPEVAALKKRMDAEGVLYSDGIEPRDFAGLVIRHFSQLLLQYAKAEAGRERQSAQAVESRSVAVALLLEGQTVLVKRSAGCKTGAGLWQIPGGKTERGETPEEAALREIREELGLELRQGSLRRLSSIDTPHLKKQGMLRIVLFTCPIGREECERITLNEENERWELFPLSDLLSDQRPFLGINKQLLAILWREHYLVGPLAALAAQAEAAADRGMPEHIAGVPAAAEQPVYALLSLLGLAVLDHGVDYASEPARRIVEEIISLSRQGIPLFDDSGNDYFRDLMLPGDDYPRLRMHKEKMMFSHQSLMSILSCRARLKNSERDVTDVLLFGTRGEDSYVLLRWDFLANKYQLISGGTDGDDWGSGEEKAAAILSRRFSEIFVGHFDFHAMTRFQTRHFSAGSVDNDPILRTYNVDVLAATPRNPLESDFCDFLRSINASTELSVEYFWDISRDQAHDLNYYQWCRLEDLMESGGTYQGREVRGFSELVSRMGKRAFSVYLSRALRLNEQDVDCDPEALIDQVNAKMRGKGN